MDNKAPLSKAIGEWDNGYGDREKITNTLSQIRNVLLHEQEYSQKYKKGQLQINLRGSMTKNSANSDSDDLDIHVCFITQVDLFKEKNKIEELLLECFGQGNVIRHLRSLVITRSKKRLKADVIVCRQLDGCIALWNDEKKKEENFYPALDQKEVGKRNDATNGRFMEMVRAFKSVRNLVCTENTGKYHIPSYGIECMLFWVKPKTYRKIRDKDPEQDIRKLFLAIEQSVRARLKNINDLDKAKEINGEKPLFSNIREYNAALEFWKDLHKYLTLNYDFER